MLDLTSRCSGKEPALLPRRFFSGRDATRHERAAEIEPMRIHVCKNWQRYNLFSFSRDWSTFHAALGLPLCTKNAINLRGCIFFFSPAQPTDDKKMYSVRLTFRLCLFILPKNDCLNTNHLNHCFGKVLCCKLAHTHSTPFVHFRPFVCFSVQCKFCRELFFTLLDHLWEHMEFFLVKCVKHKKHFKENTFSKLETGPFSLLGNLQKHHAELQETEVSV